MRIYDALPWQIIANHLKPSVERKSGFEGALYGAAFGAMTSMAAMSGRNTDPVKPILAATAVGIILGAVDGETISCLGRNQAKK